MAGSATGFPVASGLDLNLSICVAICTRHRPVFLEACLQSVGKLQPAAEEILVIDNSEGDEQTRRLAEHFGARYIVESTPGLSHARNRGLAASRCDIVAYLDDDAVPNRDWLGLLLQPFQDPSVAAVTGKIVTPETALEDFQQMRRSVSNQDPHWFEMATFGGLGLGSKMALRRSACDGWTAFDQRLGRGAPFQIAEENYAFASLLSRGFTAVFLPDAIVSHPPLTRKTIDQEARNSFAYWLLLFSEFPERRTDLIRFLFRRLQHQRLTWPRNSQDPGDIVTSGWWIQVKAVLGGFLLFFKTHKQGQKLLEGRPLRNTRPGLVSRLFRHNQNFTAERFATALPALQTTYPDPGGPSGLRGRPSFDRQGVGPAKDGPCYAGVARKKAWISPAIEPIEMESRESAFAGNQKRNRWNL